jgi:hypothetical protein
LSLTTTPTFSFFRLIALVPVAGLKLPSSVRRAEALPASHQQG